LSRWLRLGILISLIIAGSATAFGHADQTTSERGLTFITKNEGTVLNLYDDQGPGKGDCTIGIGYLVHCGPCDGSDPKEQDFLNGITKEKANELFKTKLTQFEQDVNKIITVPLTQNQFDALVSFTYNLGPGALKDIAVDLNAGNYDTVPQEMNLYNKEKVDGILTVSDGLVKRRSEEGNLFQKGNLFQVAGTIPIPTGAAADVLKEQGEYEDYLLNALQATELRIKKNPQDGEAWQTKGLALESLGQTTEANDAFTKARYLGYTSQKTCPNQLSGTQFPDWMQSPQSKTTSELEGWGKHPKGWGVSAAYVQAHPEIYGPYRPPDSTPTPSPSSPQSGSNSGSSGSSGTSPTLPNIDFNAITYEQWLAGMTK